MDVFFEDRREAGERLAQRLRAGVGPDPVVLALPRGGVPIAVPVARALQAPLDLLLVRKIGAPWNPELAVAAVADGAEPALVVDEDTLRASATPREYVMQELPGHLEELARRRALYLQGRAPAQLRGRTAVLVDDGIATGTTVRAAIALLRQWQPARVVLAVPVAPPDALQALRPLVDELACLHAPTLFSAVGEHYRCFDQVSDEEVVAAMRQAA